MRWLAVVAVMVALMLRTHDWHWFAAAVCFCLWVSGCRFEAWLWTVAQRSAERKRAEREQQIRRRYR